jgi:uncharacterized protein YneF (UPF0154 family)
MNPLKIRWGILLTGVIIGFFLSSASRVSQSEDEKEMALSLKQMLAIKNIEKTMGREPSSKAEIDAEVARWEDYALRVRTLQKSGKPFDTDFVLAPWHSSK